MTITQSGGAGSGTITCTNEATLTMSAIAAAVSGMTKTGASQFRCDRRLNFVNCTLTMQNESLMHSFSVTDITTMSGWKIDSTSVMRIYDSSVRWELSGITGIYPMFGLLSDTNHGTIDFRRSWFWLGNGINGTFFRANQGTTNNNNLIDCTFIGEGQGGNGRLGGANSSILRTRYYKGSAMSQTNTIGTYSDVTVDGVDKAYIWNTIQSFNNTIKNVVFTNIVTSSIGIATRIAGTQTLKVINMVSNLGRTVALQGAPGVAGQIGIVEWIYTHNANVLDGATPLENVRTCIFRNAGTNLINKLTNSSGNLTETEVIHSFHTVEISSIVLTAYGPFKIRYGKYGFLLNERTSAIDTPLNDAIIALPDISVVASEAAALAYTGITDNWATSTVSVSGTRTVQEFHDYMTATFFSSAIFSVNAYNRASTIVGGNFDLLFPLTLTGSLSGTDVVLLKNGSVINGVISAPVTLSSQNVTTDTIDNFTGTLTINGTSVLTINAVGGGTLPQGTSSAASKILVSSATAGDIFDAAAFDFNASTVIENTSGNNIIITLETGQTEPTKLETSGTITFSAPLVYQSVTVTNGVAGTRLQIYDITSSTELYNNVPGSFPHTWTDSSAYVADREIRVRAMHQSGATAKLFVDSVIGIATSSEPALSVRLNQEDDTVYITNAINGSAVTNITIDDGNLLVEIDTGAVSWTQIYAYETYWLFTEEGIRDEGRFIEAKDTANYILYDFKIKNVTSPEVALTITNGWGYDSVTGTTIELFDTTGGAIFAAPDRVVAFATGSGLSPEEQAQLTAIATDTPRIKNNTDLIPGAL